MKKLLVLLLCVCFMLPFTACAGNNNTGGISAENINSVWGCTAELTAKEYGLSLDAADQGEANQGISTDIYYTFSEVEIEGCKANLDLHFMQNGNADAGLYLMQLTFASAADTETVLEKLRALPDYVQFEGGNGYFGADAVSADDMEWLAQYTNVRKGEQGFLTEQGRYDSTTGKFSGSGSYVGGEYPLVTLRANPESNTIQLSNGITVLLQQKEAIEKNLKGE